MQPYKATIAQIREKLNELDPTDANLLFIALWLKNEQYQGIDYLLKLTKDEETKSKLEYMRSQLKSSYMKSLNRYEQH